MKSVLLVEDDLSLANGLEYALKKNGFSIKIVPTVSEFMNLYQSASIEKIYEIVLLDINLPDGNGYDLCRMIRKDSNLPVIFLTACDEEVNVVMGLDIGGDDYISKPFRVNELISRINAVLRRNSAPRQSRSLYSDGPFTIDSGAARFYKNNSDLQLTSTEFRLVNVLLENKGNIVMRDKLLEQLWDSNDHFVDTNTLSVYIRRLREKIEKDPANPEYIETIRGTGYRWR